MKGALGVPEMGQNLSQLDTESLSMAISTLVTAVRSLGRRAQALDALMDSASAPRHLDTTRVDITVGAAAYFAAVEVATEPPQPKDTAS